MKSFAKMTIIFSILLFLMAKYFSISLFLMALNKIKKRFRPGSKYDYQVIAFIMLPLQYGSVLANIILITVFRLSVDPMV